MDILDEIVAPYRERLEKFAKSSDKNIDLESVSPDLYLFMKWAYRVEKGWYGFSLADAPLVWAMIIDKYLARLEVEAPDFKIHQIKLKFGGLRFYVQLNLNDNLKAEMLLEEIGRLEELLQDKKLIY